MSTKPLLIMLNGRWVCAFPCIRGGAWAQWVMGDGGTPSQAYASWAAYEIARLEKLIPKWRAT